MLLKSKFGNILRPDWTKGKLRDNKKLWLDKNENSDEFLTKKISSILNKLDLNAFFAYPDLSITYKKLGKHLGLNPRNLLLTAGSDLGIKAVFETFIKEKDIVLRTQPTFIMYSTYTKAFKAREKILKYKKTKLGPKINFDTIINYLKKYKVKMLCLPNPDVPTGHFLSKSQIKYILNLAKKTNTLVLIDEAYYPFHPDTFISLIDKYKNLIIIRTMSKAWGLAGGRIGFVVSSKKNIVEMHKIKPMYEINNIAANILNNLIQNKKFVNGSVKRLLEGKNYFKKKLEEYGFEVLQKQGGNFLHVNFKTKQNKILKSLEKKVYFKIEKHACLKGFVRFSLANKKKFETLLKIIKKNRIT